MIAEPYNTLLFVIAIPLLLQIYKVYKAKTGNTLSKGAKQVLALVLATVFTVLSGGFVGLEWPALPVWGGDVAVFITVVLEFTTQVVAVVGGAWVTLSGLYEVVLKRIFEVFTIATPEAIAERDKIGFLG